LSGDIALSDIFATLSFSAILVTRGRQESVNVAGAGQTPAGDLSPRIDVVSQKQEQGRPSANQSVEVAHHAVSPQESAAVVVHVARKADRPALVVNAESAAGKVTGERAEILHAGVLRPEESVAGCVARQIRATDN
jgi:hypothetical protein